MGGLRGPVQSLLEPYACCSNASTTAEAAIALYPIGSEEGMFRNPWEVTTVSPQTLSDSEPPSEPITAGQAFDALAMDFQVGCLTRETAEMASHVSLRVRVGPRYLETSV